mmetsp:Transcript_4770/g.7200  ORF Transcript_4770/g.7200 Transcript_4770/m.7200 type:complete len:292 (+) Transcript_4770:44-919(+)
MLASHHNRNRGRYEPLEKHEHHDQSPKDEVIKGRSIVYKFIRYALILSLAICITFFVGIRKEERRVALAKSTRSKYTSNSVCTRYRSQENGNCTEIGNDDGENGNGTQCLVQSKFEFITTKDKEEAISAGLDIAHCGECGKCSTQNDIDLMIRTKETLTEDATICALHGLVLGDYKMDSCLSDIGFTPGCSTCWRENIKCTQSKCLFKCMKARLLSEPNNVHPSANQDIIQVDGEHSEREQAFMLNACLECDEKLCGPDFIDCAGANRRRLGIVSDIKREGDEQCRVPHGT